MGENQSMVQIKSRDLNHMWDSVDKPCQHFFSDKCSETFFYDGFTKPQ